LVFALGGINLYMSITWQRNTVNRPWTLCQLTVVKKTCQQGEGSKIEKKVLGDLNGWSQTTQIKELKQFSLEDPFWTYQPQLRGMLGQKPSSELYKKPSETQNLNCIYSPTWLRRIELRKHVVLRCDAENPPLSIFET
jgi:hypothetical protein